ncbi:MAG TPA: hypothetical protein VFT96_09770 [Gemmatimonadaceae bacterium]|nr:hypothetical protein [Gemmatimonadaceae bacterium]
MRLLLVAAALQASAIAVHAQDADTPRAPDCLASIPASAFTRVPVHLEASTDSASRRILPVADTLTLLVARVLTASFGPGAPLPDAAGFVHWRQLDGGVQVTVHRDGRLTWSLPHPTGEDSVSGMRPDTVFNEARNLIMQALMVVHDAGVAMSWPAGASGDSLLFRLAYVRSSVTQDGAIQPLEARFAVPVFTLPVPWEREVAVHRMPTPRYPETSRSRGAEATIILRFVVDSTGRLKQGTARDQWPEDRPRPRGDLGHFYRLFVRSAVESLADAQFVPALIGGCAVDRVASMPFVFGLRR